MVSSPAVSKEELEAKIKEYSSFIDKKLYPVLKKRVEEREKVESEIADYQDLTLKLVAISGDTSLESMVDLGHQIVYCRAISSDITRVNVHVGMGFHAELTIPEALTYCEKRQQFLDKVLAQRADAASKVAQHVESSLVILEQLAQEMKEHS